MIHVNFRFILVRAVILLTFMFYALPGLAAPSAQGEDQKAEADRLYQERFDLFSQGDYQAAIDRFKKASSIYQEIADQSQEGATLYNIQHRATNFASPAMHSEELQIACF